MLLLKQSRYFIAVAAFLGATAVMFGAYASHGLSSWASTEQVSQVQVAAQYQLFHSIALIVASLLASVYPNRLLTMSLYSFVLGVLFFSGSLYYLVFIGSKSLVLMTPLGGLLLIIAWLLIVLAMLLNKK